MMTGAGASTKIGRFVKRARLSIIFFWPSGMLPCVFFPNINLLPQEFEKGVFFACIVPQTLLGITPGLIFKVSILCLQITRAINKVHTQVPWGASRFSVTRPSRVLSSESTPQGMNQRHNPLLKALFRGVSHDGSAQLSLLNSKVLTRIMNSICR